MAFKDDKLKPKATLVRALADTCIFDKVRATCGHISRRNRQCFVCNDKIMKGDPYISHQFKYDIGITTIGFHVKCFN